MLKSVDPRVETACFQRLKLKCDEPLSSFAFKFDLRHYKQELWDAKHAWGAERIRCMILQLGGFYLKAGRCRSNR
jgi:hypothetical protein